MSFNARKFCARKNNCKFFIVAVMCLFPLVALASELLIPSGYHSATYLAKLSGNVNNERFNNAMVLVTLMPATPDDINPYELVIEGYPESNSTNIFFWTTRDTTMEVYGHELVCKLKRWYGTKRPNIFFFYISPVLLEVPEVTQREEEAEELARKTALPIKVYANVASLKVAFSGDQVRGQVYMNGYDVVEKSYVHYNAYLVGSLIKGVHQKLEKKKNIGSHMIEPETEE